jgi:sugar-specific transcriptional regulator TrmB
MSRLSTENILKILKDFGLTKKEGEIYVFLAKHGVQRSGEIANGIKTHRGEVYRMLKSLQTKGLIHSTLESPSRFATVPFETAIDSFIKTKKEEVASVESARQDLLEDWNLITRHEPEIQLEKFVVIEGRQKIYSKILMMVNETKKQLSATAIVPALVRIDQFGILDAAFTHPLISQVQFRFLTELSEQNVEEAKAFLKRIPARGIDLKGRTPELGLKLYPQMVIRDEEEAIFFIRPQSNLPASEQDNVCLWTNCKSLVLAFSAMFEESWSKATDIQKKLNEIENGKPTPKTANNPAEAYRKYTETINAAQKEILIMTSSEGFLDLSKEITQLKEWEERGVSVKIMAPITSENLKAAYTLPKFCEVKHVPPSNLNSTIIDGHHLFQFKISPSSQERTESFLEDGFYTSDTGTVEKTKNMLNRLWGNAQVLSAVSLETISPETKDNSLSEGTIPRTVKKVFDLVVEDENRRKITEKDVLKTIINGQLNPPASAKKGVVIQYGTGGQAIIHMPASFNLPTMLFHMFHFEKTSTFGAEDVILIYLLRETPKGNLFLPVAFVHDNPKTSRFLKEYSANTPVAQNIQLVKKDELQVRIHGNTLFCGWTVEIPLLPSSLHLKPACITLEGYGSLKATSFTVDLPSGFKHTHEQNGFEAFVTFLSPKSNYSGPGTDGFIARELISTAYPPERNRNIKI